LIPPEPLRRLLGVDLGDRRVGLAVGDESSGVVRPLATIRRGSLEEDARTLAHIVEEQRVAELVVGLPRNMDGSEGEQARRTREWAASIAEELRLPVSLRDERLTSEAAETAMGPAGRGRSGGPPSAVARGRRRARVDREAARLILEAELRHRAGMTSR